MVEGLAARDSARPPIALALGAIGDVDAAAPLERLLEQGGEDSVAAAVSLGRLGQSRSVKPLVQLLRDSQAPASREAVHALGLLRDPTVQKALVRQLFSDRSEIRAEAVRAITSLGLASSTRELDALRSDYYLEVRRAVDTALGVGSPGSR